MFTDPPLPLWNPGKPGPLCGIPPGLHPFRQLAETIRLPSCSEGMPAARGDYPKGMPLARGVLFAHFEYAYSFFFSTALSIRHNFLLIGTFLRPNNNFFNNFFAHLIIQFLCNAVALHVNFITPRRAFDMNN